MLQPIMRKLCNIIPKLLFCIALSLSVAVYAQEDSGAGKASKGYLTGSFESTGNYYFDDEPSGAIAPNDRFGSNNYLKLDYYRKNLSIGAQLESYLPALQGFPNELDKTRLTNLYVNWKDENFSVTAGSFYEQFGSGLLFRSWEDRMLGLNNAVMGARFSYNYKGIVGIKAIWGMPRLGMEYVSSQVRGADLMFSVSDLAKWYNTSLSIEGSVLSRYEKISADLEDAGGRPNTEGYSARLNFGTHGFSMKAEYVDAGNKYYQNPDMSSDLSYLTKRGNAQLLELSYNDHGLGVNLTGRRLEWMGAKITNSGDFVTSSSNMMNYIPAVCTQYTYLLTNLHPYSPQIGDVNYGISGEIGGQLDVYYNFRRGTALGGKRGMKIHANFSSYYTLHSEGSFKAGNLLYRDFSVDIEKKFTRDFKATLLYSMQEQNKNYGKGKATRLQNIVVLDMQYKYTDSFSTRMELQYLATHEDEKDWMAVLIEANFAPNWSIWASDMYNHGNPGKKLNFYNAGVSYAKSRTRVALGFGRFKAGYLCSGGVCRRIDAYTGANLQITTSF